MTAGQAVSCSFHSCNRTLVLPSDPAVWKIKCCTATHHSSFLNVLSLLIVTAIFLQCALDEVCNAYLLAAVVMC